MPVEGESLERFVGESLKGERFVQDGEYECVESELRRRSSKAAPCFPLSDSEMESSSSSSTGTAGSGLRDMMSPPQRGRLGGLGELLDAGCRKI